MIPVGEVNAGEDYRLKRIADVQTAIETKLGHYEQRQSRKRPNRLWYRRGVAGLLGIVSAGCDAVARRLESKISKHERTVQLAKSKLSTIVDLISRALNDGRVSQEEFSSINAELVKFRQLKAEIRANTVALQQPQEAQPKLGETPAEFEKRI
ncbi:hypothetical protein QZH41_000072 [Actinostola sp. cb2023]|nr:hypothetical protein QZH41_000072 [Actinostola sp. cb2023]